MAIIIDQRQQFPRVSRRFDLIYDPMTDQLLWWDKVARNFPGRHRKPAWDWGEQMYEHVWAYAGQKCRLSPYAMQRCRNRLGLHYKDTTWDKAIEEEYFLAVRQREKMDINRIRNKLSINFSGYKGGLNWS